MTNIEQFTSYDRITDVLMYFTTDITLKFVTVLAKYSQSYGRRFFQYEVEKNSQVSGGGKTKNINRNMNFFYVIDNKNDFTNNFVIRPNDAIMILDIIDKKILPWFYADSKEYAFQYINDSLQITEYKPVLYTQNEIHHIKFDPCVIMIGDKYSHGIKMTINGIYSYEIELEKFMNFKYFLNCDMYNAACSLVNYVKTEPYGVEVFRPQGLGGGRIEDKWGDEPIEYNTIESNRTNPDKPDKPRSNSFLDSI